MEDEKLQQFLNNNYSKATSKAYFREIEIFLSNNKEAANYHFKDITNCLSSIRKRYNNPKTINRILASIKAYYSYLCNANYRKDNPAKSIILKDKQNRDIQLQDLFTTEELELLLTAKKERYSLLNERNKVLISLMIYQALKPQEIANIEITDIHLEATNIYIKSTPKTNSRTLPLKANQILLFKKYLEETRLILLNKNEMVIELVEMKAFIIGHRGESMTAEDITKHIKRNYNIYKPRNVNAQTIRQSVIANLLKQNNDLRIVQSFAGHKYPSTTERYKQTNVEALKEALQKHHPIK